MTPSEQIDKLQDRIEIIKLAVDGLQPLLPAQHEGKVDTIIVALDGLEDELSMLAPSAEHAPGRHIAHAGVGGRN